MSREDEYNLLVRTIEKKRNEYYAAQGRIRQYDALLDRLKPVKKEISGIKDAFHDQVIRKDERGKESTLWAGDRYQQFLREVDDVVTDNKDYHRNSLDYVLDSLNDEITRIENKRLSEYGLLGELGKLINSLANEIENFFN